MMRRIIHTGQWLLATCLLLIGLTACTDDEWASGKQGVIDENGMISLTLHTNVPGLKVTRAVDINGEQIATLWVLAFNEDGYMISRVLAEQTNDVKGTTGGTGTFSASVPGSTRILHFLANVNMDNFSDQSNLGRHENEVIAPLVSSSGNLVYWGRREFADATELTNFATNSKTNPVILYRNQALITYEITNSAITFEGWAALNQYAYGTVAPFDASAVGEANDTPFHFDLSTHDFVTTLPEAYNVKQTDVEDVSQASDEAGDPRYVFESPNPEDDQLYLIMRLRKNDKSKYYKIMLVDDDKNPYTIIRNHKYTVTVNDVNEAYGVATFEEAKTATPANNPWITISDEIPEVMNGDRTLRIEGETTVIYQQAGTQTIDFYYNGPTQPAVSLLSDEGVVNEITSVTWDSGTGVGSITLNINAPAAGTITNATLQIKEASGVGVLSRRVKILLTEPFEFTPVWVSSEIPLLDDEAITLLFNIPDNFPQELLPIDVKFGCDLIDGQGGTEALKVITEENNYTVPVYNEATNSWETETVTPDWNYKYVYSADRTGQHRVNFRTILTNLSEVETASEFHIYMEGDDPRNGQDLFAQRDLFFAFQPDNSQYRIMLGGGEAANNYTTRTISNLEPIYGEEISIPFTLGTINGQSIVADGNVPANTQIWVYYDPTLLNPDPNWDGRTGTDYFGNSYKVFTTSLANNTVKFTTRSPNFDCYIVLAAKTTNNYGTFDERNPDSPDLGVNSRGYRSASVTIRSTGRLNFNPSFSTDNSNFTSVADGGRYEIPYGTGQNVYLRIDVPAAAQDKAFMFKLGTKYLTPVDAETNTQWARWSSAEGDGWTYTFQANETEGSKTFQFVTNRLASGETLTLASGDYVGFNPVTVNLANADLTGTIQLPDGVAFDVASPFVVLERVSDGTRIGSFAFGTNLQGQSSASYTLALRGEYNLSETDRVNVRWAPTTTSEVYIYSGLLRDIMTSTTITLEKSN